MGYYRDVEKGGGGFFLAALAGLLLLLLFIAFTVTIIILILCTLSIIVLVGYKWGAKRFSIKSTALAGVLGSLISVIVFILFIISIPYFFEYGIKYSLLVQNNGQLDWLTPFSSDYFNLGINTNYNLGANYLGVSSNSSFVGTLQRTSPVLLFADGLFYSIIIYLITYLISVGLNHNYGQTYILSLKRHITEIKQKRFTSNNPIIDLFNTVFGWYRGVLVFGGMIIISGLLTSALYSAKLISDESQGIFVLSIIVFLLNGALFITLTVKTFKSLSQKKAGKQAKLAIYYGSVLIPFFLFNGIVVDYTQIDSPFSNEVSTSGVVLVSIVVLNALGIVLLRKKTVATIANNTSHN